AGKGKARRRAFGLGSGAGAFLALGLGPLAGAPPAHADGLDVIIDPIVNSIMGSFTDSFAGLDALLGIDPTAGVDLALPAADVAAAGTGGWETFWTDLVNSFDVGSVNDVGAAASATDSLSSFWQGLEQDWISSPFGAQVDTALNSWFDQVSPAASDLAGACGL